MNMEFIEALKDLEKERGINMDVLIEAIEAALISAYKKHYGSSQNVRVEINRNNGEIHVIYRRWKILQYRCRWKMPVCMIPNLKKAMSLNPRSLPAASAA